jgi:hypothetical protein
VIRLRDGSSTLGFIRFFDLESPIPADMQRPSGDAVLTEMNLPAGMFGAVVDLLRNEGPVLFFFGDGRGQLITEFEAVGEGEAGR